MAAKQTTNTHALTQLQNPPKTLNGSRRIGVSSTYMYIRIIFRSMYVEGAESEQIVTLLRLCD